jgi:Ca2+-binding RTX toxin-like protein
LAGFNGLNRASASRLGFSKGSLTPAALVQRHQLVVLGNAGDSLTVSGGGGETWSNIGTLKGSGAFAGLFNVWNSSKGLAQLLVHSAITHSFAFTGTDAPDDLQGTTEKDLLSGGGGNDTLAGGLGLDTLSGGDGNDTFRFLAAPATADRDRITDFVSGVDRLSFSRAAFAGFGRQTTLQATQFAAGPGLTTASTAKQRFLYDTTSGILRFDPDGTGRGTAREVVQLGLINHPLLAATDVVLNS